MILCDHIATITDVDFSRDDSRIITTSSDGSIYYWKVGALNRDQEYVFKGMAVNKVALSKTRQKEAHIIAVCESHGEYQAGLQAQTPAETMMLRRQSTVLMRRATRNGASALEGAGEGPPGLTKVGSMGPADHFFSLAGGDGAGPHSPGHRQHKQQTFGLSTRRSFLAVWKDALSGSPRILELDSEVRSIALGDTDGPDKFDICVLGMADGRILISVLPLPSSFHRVLDTAGSGSGMSITMPPAGVTAAGAAAGALSRGGGANKRHKGMIASSAEMTTSGAATPAGKRGGGGTLGAVQEQADGMMSLGAGTDADSSTAGTASLAQRDDLSMFSRQGSAAEGHESGGGGGSVQGGGGSVKEGTGGAGGAQQAMVQQERLDESRCRQLRMHCGAVTLVAVSRNGMWVFSAGADGVVHMYATSKRGFEMTEVPYAMDALENRFHIVEGSKLRALRGQLSDTERLIETNKKDYDLKVDKILESKEKMVLDLQARMQKEIKHRDETILHSRNEYLKLKTSMNGEIAAIRKQCNDSISDLELTYEQKLSQEALYLDKLKQAYDEYVVHSRMDLAELQRRTDQRVEGVEADRNTALLEAEKQKKTVLQYFDYVKIRNDELMQSLEQSQADER